MFFWLSERGTQEWQVAFDLVFATRNCRKCAAVSGPDGFMIPRNAWNLGVPRRVEF